MKFLVIYYLLENNKRFTISDHLFSFKVYRKDIKFHYFNAITGIPGYLSKIYYDGIILHYTFLAQRFSKNVDCWKKFISGIKYLRGYIVAIPQDEYDDTDKLNFLFREYGIKTVFTCFNRKEDYLKAYPKEKSHLEYYIPVYTGYVNTKIVKKINNYLKDLKFRPIDIGYRARKLPYYFGRHGQLKYELADIFLKKLKKTDFLYNIETTDDTHSVYLGFSWHKFLLRCKATLGCEGGSSLLDADGDVKFNVSNYLKKNPTAGFQEVYRACLYETDNNIMCFTLSPRHFEAAMTKTLQILIEGNYGGVFLPNIHYLELKRDYSNIDKVLELLKNEDYCQNIANNCYKDIVESGKYSYSRFVDLVIEQIKSHSKSFVYNKSNFISKDRIRNNFLFLIINFYIIMRDLLIKVISFIIEYLKKSKFYNFLKIRKKYFLVRIFFFQ